MKKIMSILGIYFLILISTNAHSKQIEYKSFPVGTVFNIIGQKENSKYEAVYSTQDYVIYKVTEANAKYFHYYLVYKGILSHYCGPQQQSIINKSTIATVDNIWPIEKAKKSYDKTIFLEASEKVYKDKPVFGLKMQFGKWTHHFHINAEQYLILNQTGYAPVKYIFENTTPKYKNNALPAVCVHSLPLWFWRKTKTSLKQDNYSTSKLKQDLRSLLTKDNSKYNDAINRLYQYFDTRAVPTLISELSSQHWRISYNSAITLGRLRDRRAILPLINTLADTRREVKHGAVKALGKLKDDRAISPLIKTLKKVRNNQKSYSLKQNIIIAIWEIGSNKAIEALLLTAKTDDDPELRKIALKALIHKEPLRKIEYLNIGINDPDQDIKHWAKSVLEKTKN